MPARGVALNVGPGLTRRARFAAGSAQHDCSAGARPRCSGCGRRRRGPGPSAGRGRSAPRTGRSKGCRPRQPAPTGGAAPGGGSRSPAGTLSVASGVSGSIRQNERCGFFRSTYPHNPPMAVRRPRFIVVVSPHPPQYGVGPVPCSSPLTQATGPTPRLGRVEFRASRRTVDATGLRKVGYSGPPPAVSGRIRPDRGGRNP